MRVRLESLVDEMIDAGILYEDAVAEFEKQFIMRVMERHRGNISKASAELRIHRNTLSKRIEKYREQTLSLKTSRPRRMLKKNATVK
jgi:Fis family transcriptional regulator, factor for inversion stimulation protein